MAGGTTSAAPVSTLIALSSCTKIFLGVGALALPTVVKNAGIVAFVITLFLCSLVAGVCIFRLVACAEIMQACEAKRNMYRRKIKEGIAAGTLPKQFISIDPNDVKLFDEFPELGWSNTDIIDQDKTSLPSYEHIGIAAFGKYGGFAVNASLVITQLGGNVAYSIALAQCLSEVFPNISKAKWLALLYVPLIGMANIRDMATLAKTTALSNLVYVYTLFVIFYTGFKNQELLPFEEITILNVRESASAFSTLSFAFEAIVVIMTIKSSMQYPEKFRVVMSSAMTIVCFIYFFVAIFGFLFYGQDVKAPIISNLPPGLLSNSVKIALSACLFLSWSMISFATSTLFDDIFDIYLFGLTPANDQQHQQKQSNNTYNENNNNNNIDDNIDDNIDSTSTQQEQQQQKSSSSTRAILQFAHRWFYVTLCSLIAWGFPQFDLIIAFFGSLSNSLLAYILPALFFTQIARYPILDNKYYYPYDRDGSPNPYPITGLLPADTQRCIDGNISDPLIVDNSTIIHPEEYSSNAKCSATFSFYFFPIVIVIIGGIASIIGVVIATQDLISEFGQQ